MRHLIRFAAVASLFAAGACAHGPDPLPGPPDYAPLASQTAAPHARLYADCISQAAARGSYRQVIDGGEELLLFNCDGPVASAFWSALETHSAAMDTGWAHDGRRYRSTARVQRNLIGVDYCTVDAAGGDPRCVLTFNAGDFLIAGD